jgi:perosamine synthetase
MLNLDDFIISSDASMKSVLEFLNKTGNGLVFLLEDSRLSGILTDGDIRRALIGGAKLEDSASDYMNKNFQVANIHSSPAEIYKLLSLTKTYIPIVNAKNELVRIISPNIPIHIPISEPNITQLEIDIVADVMRSNWISSTGIYVGQFEDLFARFIGSETAVSVANGTLGLVLALKTLGIGPGDEVLVPNLTFGATANAVIQIGAKPVFVDIESSSLGLDVSDAENKVNASTKAIIPVHLYGESADLQKILDFATKHSLLIIEDAAEAIGTRWQGTHVGIFGDAGVFSFFANKTITTGEGGMVVFKKPEHAELAKSIKAHGYKSNNRYWHEVWGTNLRLTNMQAAVGVAQMQRIDELISAKQSNARIYIELLQPISNQYIELPKVDTRFENSYWLFTLRINNKKLLKPLISHLEEELIETRRFFHPLNSQPAFKFFSSNSDNFPNSNSAFETGLCLPSSTKLKEEEIVRISSEIIKFFS